MCQPNEVACATLAGAGGGYECVDVSNNASTSTIHRYHFALGAVWKYSTILMMQSTAVDARMVCSSRTLQQGADESKSPTLAEARTKSPAALAPLLTILAAHALPHQAQRTSRPSATTPCAPLPSASPATSGSLTGLASGVGCLTGMPDRDHGDQGSRLRRGQEKMHHRGEWKSLLELQGGIDSLRGGGVVCSWGYEGRRDGTSI